jgi:hypothetical protein
MFLSQDASWLRGEIEADIFRRLMGNIPRWRSWFLHVRSTFHNLAASTWGTRSCSDLSDRGLSKISGYTEDLCRSALYKNSLNVAEDLQHSITGHLH